MVRVIWATCPAEFQPSAIAGRIKPAQLSVPEIGTHFSWKAKIYCRNIAAMNTGSEIPSREKPMNRRSGSRFFFIAEQMPQAMPTIQANSAANTARISVLTNALPISCDTGFPRE